MNDTGTQNAIVLIESELSDRNWTCLNGNQYIYDSDTGLWDVVENSEVCEQEQEDEEIDPTIPKTADELIDEAVEWFYQPFFWAIIGTLITISLGAFITKGENWQIPLIFGIVIMLFFVVIGWFELWVASIIVISVILLFSNTIMRSIK